jgi:hypothetical protein
MSESPRFGPEAQRYLDGDPAARPDGAEGASARRLEQVVAAYAAQLHAPGAEVDRAVMRRIREAPPSRSWWSWLVAPLAVRVRPVVLALAAAVVLVVVWRVGSREAPVQDAASTVLVRFQLAAPAAHDVTLAGSFNGWSAGIPLRKSAVSGLWVVTLPLPIGEHQYLFHVDGNQWIPDPGAHAQVDDGFGRTNSVLVVGPRGVAGP